MVAMLITVVEGREGGGGDKKGESSKAARDSNVKTVISHYRRPSAAQRWIKGRRHRIGQAPSHHIPPLLNITGRGGAGLMSFMPQYSS